MKLTITKIDRKPINTVKGQSTMVFVKAREYGDVSLSCFENEFTKSWTVGMTMDVEVKQNGKYLNIVLPKVAGEKSGDSISELREIKGLLEKILQVLSKGKQEEPF